MSCPRKSSVPSCHTSSCANARWGCWLGQRGLEVGLKWSNVDMQNMQVSVVRSVVRNRLGNVKTRASGKPVLLYRAVCVVLNEWRRESLYDGDDDFVFLSIKAARKISTDAGHGSAKAQPSCARLGRHHRQGDWMAQLPPFTGDEPAFDGC
jgi:hypothetical protein